jgi:hypothetical protein
MINRQGAKVRDEDGRGVTQTLRRKEISHKNAMHKGIGLNRNALGINART